MTGDRKPGARPTVFITGYFGFGNVGDEAILAAMVGDLRALRPELRAVVTSNSPRKTEEAHGVDAIFWRDVHAISGAVRQADLVLVGGGGLFQEYWGVDPDALLTPGHWGISFYCGPAILASIEERPLMLYAVGVGPLGSEHGRSYVRAACDAARAITVRDAGSRRLLEEMGVPPDRVEQTADPAFSLEPASLDPGLEAVASREGGPVVGVALRNWTFGVAPGFWEREVAAGLDLFLSRQAGRLLFVPFHRSALDIEDDQAVAERVRKLMKLGERTSVLEGARSPAQVAGIVGSCDLVVGMRLHSVVLAALGAVPVLALGYDAKVSEQMDQLGLAELVLPVANIEGGVLAGLMERALSRREELRDRLAEAKQELRRKARRNAEVAVRLLEEAPVQGAGLSPAQARILRRLLANQLRQVHDLGSDLDGLRSELEAAARREQELQGLQGELMRIYQSRLWKVGTIYRRLRSVLHRIVRPRTWPSTARLVRLRTRLSIARGARRLFGKSHEKQLREVKDRILRSRGAVVFLPSVGWSIHLFQRPHHLARTLAGRGYVAIFDASNGLDDVDGFKEIEANLFLYRGPQELLHRLPDPILWAFPYNFHLLDGFPPGTRVVYDWIDDLSVFPHERHLLERNHERALREATVVASVARSLHEQARAVRPDALYVPNGVEYERFADPRVPRARDPKVERFGADGRPIAGYYGALAEWFDYELLDEVIRSRPDWNFVLIGPMYDRSLKGQALLKRPNLLWIGPRDYHDLPGYLRFFDVAMIPFRINDITLATSPLKLYEYLAAGKPVVATPMPECESLGEVHIARSAGEFSVALDEALRQARDGAFREKLRSLAQAHSWSERVNGVLTRLEAAQQSAGSARPGTAADADVEVATRATAPDGALSPGALEVAQRFAGFRGARNRAFFNALAEHFSDIRSNPCLPMYFEFAVTSNDRGRALAAKLRRRFRLRGRRFLDVGCAYGGFLVAFAEEGARVSGIDINERLLSLAKVNLEENGIHAPLLRHDALVARPEFDGAFDLIVANDVVEHVRDLKAFLMNLADWLSADGTTYLEIPNGAYPPFVRSDGHHQLFGITLLEYDQARDYHARRYSDGGYDTFNYLDLPGYREVFASCGLSLTVLPETLDGASVRQVDGHVAELREARAAGIESVPAEFRGLVAERVDRYLSRFEAAPRKSPAERQDFLLRYGPSFWRAIATRIP